MSFTRACFALALGCTLAAAGYGCGNKNGTGGSGAGGGSSSGAPACLNAMGGGPTITTMGTGGDDPTVAPCASCLAAKCADQIQACNPDGGGVNCYAIQACIDAVCFGLSMQASPDEGMCQSHCQDLHPEAKAAHLAWVNCATDEPMPVVTDAGPGDAGAVDAGPPATCIPPCAFYSYDYDRCVADQTAGACKAPFDACNACSDCKEYVGCATNCASWSDCQKCFATPSGTAGEQLYEAYQLCLDRTCFAQGWLPTF
jgi:hypothetical protein